MGYSLWVHEELDTTEWLNTHTHTHFLLARATQETWLPSCDYGVELGIGEKSNMISEKKNKNIFKGADLSDLVLVPFCFSFIFLIPGIQM